MPLHKIADFDPDYRSHFGQEDIFSYDLYSGNEKVGSIDDLLVDDDGNFRYIVANTGIWVFGKKVLVPIGQVRLSHSDRRVYLNGLTRQQVEAMPTYEGNMPVDYDTEEQVRSTYRPIAAGSTPVDTAASLDATPGYDRNSYSYDRDASLYTTNDTNHQNIKLYQERLLASKTRRKAGEVSVGKHVETETQRVSVPIEKERVVVERVAATDTTAVAPGSVNFGEGEVARVEVYEEKVNIGKEAFVREEVRVRKEVDRETVEAEETIRREELDVTTDGTPRIDNQGDPNQSKPRKR